MELLTFLQIHLLVSAWAPLPINLTISSITTPPLKRGFLFYFICLFYFCFAEYNTMSKDKRIDAYIAKAQPFAQPIMKKLRELIHKANPDVEETIKWGMPSFDYKGPYFSFAAFKQHCAAGFWKYKLIKDPKGYLGDNALQGGEAMGNMGRMTSIKDLPPDSAMIDFFKQAKKLNDEGVKQERPKP